MSDSMVSCEWATGPPNTGGTMNPVDPDGHVIADMLSQADFAHSQPSIPTFPVQNNLNPRIGVGRTG